LTEPISDQNCLKCHAPVTQRGYVTKEPISLPGARLGGGEDEGRSNHWHQFLARWQTADPNAGTCTSCHAGHITGASIQTGFMNSQTVLTVCDACHQVLHREGEE
jgi:hypothetical protein